MSKVFLSYNRKDEDIVKELYGRLTRDGVECFFDKESIAWGSARVVDLEHGLDECEMIVLVLSPDFCRTEWPRVESTNAIVNDPAGFRMKLRCLLRKPCEEDFSRFLRACRHIDISTNEKFEKVYPMICSDLGSEVTEKYANEFLIGHANEVAAIFKNSWDLASSTAQAVLQSLSFFGPLPVPRRLLRKIIDIPLENVLGDPLDAAIGELAGKLSLIELDADNDPWTTRLISAFVRETTDTPANLFESVCNAVVAEMARVTDESDIAFHGQLEKIAHQAELLISSDAIKTGQALDLTNYLCLHHWKRGRFGIAKKHARKAVDISVRHFVPGHPRIATSLSNLGEVLRNLGELKAARDLLQKAMESDERSFEPGHPIIAIRQSILAVVLQELGELEAARDLLRKALDSDKKSFEPGHPKIAIRQSNLAVVLQELGEFEEARALAGQAYRSFRDRLGPEHPYTKVAKKTWEFF